VRDHRNNATADVGQGIERGACVETTKIKELILRKVYTELMATENRKKAKKYKLRKEARMAYEMANEAEEEEKPKDK
jgi:uncharacterized protein (UPF0254 family)